MDENIYRLAEQIVQLHQEAYETYLSLVEDVCSRTVSEDELSHLLDYLLDFACDEKMLGLYKRVCRKYLDIYPGCIRDYIEAYREMWEELHNPDFNRVQFEAVKNEAGLNRFVMTPTKWITQINV